MQATLGGWDHHSDIYDKPRGVVALHAVRRSSIPASARCWPICRRCPARVAGKTLLDETLVVVVAEFGRTVGALNNQGGRDHNLRMSTVCAGGGVRGGSVDRQDRRHRRQRRRLRLERATATSAPRM